MALRVTPHYNLIIFFKYNFMNSFVIDNSFITKWDPCYEKTEDDEEEYRQIVVLIKVDIKKIGTVSRETFMRLLNWKSPRLKGIVKLNEFGLYGEAIKKCLVASEDQKLSILDDLYGIGAPLFSTILHFIYPDRFPIMDIRTVEVLYNADYLKSKLRDAKRYPNFKIAILSIERRCLRWTLRQIDRALFAFHKFAVYSDQYDISCGRS